MTKENIQREVKATWQELKDKGFFKGFENYEDYSEAKEMERVACGRKT